MNHIQNSNLIAAAVGVTVGVISVASVLIYRKMLTNQQHSNTVSNLDSANKRIAELQAELEALRSQQSQQKKKRRIIRRFTSNDSTYTATDNDTDIDAFSTADTDIGDDEFYDCSDSESVVGENDIRISEELNHLDLVLNEINGDESESFNLEIYEKLQTLVQSHPENVEVVWRFAKSCYQYSEVTSDENEKRTIIIDGITFCEGVIETRHADLFKWYAILIGLNGEYLPVAQRIKNGDRFKDYVTRAIELRPNDCELHHLLGRFKFEVSNLGWFERKIASTLWSEVPSASYEEAIECFEEAEKLGNKSAENQLYLAKAYIALSQYDKAIDYLNKILETPEVKNEHPKIHTEARSLLDKYSGYR